MNNLSSYCWLVDAKIRASDKDLPVQEKFCGKEMMTCHRLILNTKQECLRKFSNVGLFRGKDKKDHVLLSN